MIAILALLVGMNFVQSGSPAMAAPAEATAAAGDQNAATISDGEWHHCLDSDYDGRAFLSPCGGDRTYYQQWQAVGSTLVDVQTGLCLDGNDRGDIYTRPCDAGQQNPYQHWHGSKGHQDIFNEKTERFLTADDTNVIGGAYIGLDRQQWTTHPVSGACAIEPLTMKIDHVADEFVYVMQPVLSQSTGPRHLHFSVTHTTTNAVTAETTNRFGVEFSVEGLKATGDTQVTDGASSSETVSVSQDFDANVPQDVARMEAGWAVYRHVVTYHWHRGAKDCSELNSPEEVLKVPYAQGYGWDCEPKPGCKQSALAANPGTLNNVPPAPAGSESKAGDGSGFRSSARQQAAAATLYKFDPGLISRSGPTPPPPPPARKPTTVSYTGARSADYHATFLASARVNSGSAPVGLGTVTFSLGHTSCTAPQGPAGDAACRLTPKDAPGRLPLRIRYSGTPDYLPGSTEVLFTIRKAVSNLRYTGTKRVANAQPAQLSGILTEGETGNTPIAGREVQLGLGEGGNKQTCTATTDTHGAASCTIPAVKQPLNADATVPVTADFGGDTYYLPSTDRAVARLEYYTGRATGLSASVNLPLASLSVGPSPDTGFVRTASATRTDTPCTASAGALLVNADALCPQVSARLAPGTAEATTRVAHVRVGLPGVPVIDISGLTATSTSTCTTTSGSATLTLAVAGRRVAVPTAPNSTIPLPGGGHIVIDEQSPVNGADSGLLVRAAHIVVPGASGHLVDVAIGTAQSAAHNCR
ncbi:choice-of-anchor P family protein [Streptomyces sp. NPDC006739]|uniref:choice-of-anchor P family protein n=1 Tax=Streptomyces sp. NPDC006739 TaxID=3364763 RepID=UPI0036A695C2